MYKLYLYTKISLYWESQPWFPLFSSLVIGELIFFKPKLIYYILLTENTIHCRVMLQWLPACYPERAYPETGPGGTD